MTRHERILSALLAAATVALSSWAQNAIAAGSYGGASFGMPTIHGKNRWYSVAMPVAGSIPSTATITTVHYQYSYKYPRPTGLQVLLCNDPGSTCFDVSNSGLGSVDFDGTGVKANTPIRFYARVNGSGTMSPLYGEAATLSVNYNDGGFKSEL